MSHIKLPTPYPPTWEGRPPHMSKGDLAIWKKFRPQYLTYFTVFYFDVNLGSTPEAPQDTDDRMKRMWKAITTKRIDVVGVRTDQIWIMEFRPLAGMSAIGNAINYTAIWRHDPPGPKPVVPAVVTDTADPDILITAERLGIIVIQTDIETQ